MSIFHSHPLISWPTRIQFVVLIVAATYSCLTPRPEDLPFSFWDKGLHFFGWGGIYLSLRLAMGSHRWILATGLILFAYSTLLECLQTLVAARQFEILDIVANGLGIATGALVWSLLMRLQLLRGLLAR